MVNLRTCEVLFNLKKKQLSFQVHVFVVVVVVVVCTWSKFCHNNMIIKHGGHSIEKFTMRAKVYGLFILDCSVRVLIGCAA